MLDLLYMESNSSAIVNNYTIVGNKMDVGIFAKSSNLGMDTILLHNNTFAKHFVWVSFCKNVSLDLMRITENEFKGSIIEIKSCVGRLANTYIENDDHLSVAAISVTSTDEYEKHVLFELTNNTITWSYGLSFSFRQIIDLTGRINISNVNVLVSSIADIEVLRYSTKLITAQGPDFQIFSKNYDILFLFISCGRANVEYIATHDTIRCTPSVQDTYTLPNGSLIYHQKAWKTKNINY